jgi:uncharacterized protein DUF559
MKLNDGTPGSDYERLFAAILDAFAVDYSCQIVFHDYWLEHIGVGSFRVDFVIPHANLIIELDGPGHGGWKRRRADRMQDEFLRSLGFTVLRIQNKELDEDIHIIASRIYELLYESMQESRVRRVTPGAGRARPTR